MPRPLRLAALALMLLVLPSFASAQDAAPGAEAQPAAPASDLPAVLGQLPANYASAIVVPHLGALDAGLAAFESASVLELGELQDVVGRFKREMGVARGVDDGGSMAVVVIEPGDRPIVVMLLPVSDAEALAASLGAEPDAAGGVVDVTLPSGEAGALRLLDGYAVLGAQRQVVEAYVPADDADAFVERFGTMGAAALAESQLCFAFDPTLMDPDGLGAELTSYALAVLQHADALLAYDIAPREMLPMLGSMSQMVARGTDAAVVAFDFSAQGVGYQEAYRLNGETALADLVPGAMANDLGGDAEATDAADTLAKLPDGSAVFAIAGNPAAVGFVEMFDRFGGLLGLDPRHALGSAKPALQGLLAQADHAATAYYELASANQATSRWMNTVSVFETQDPAAFAASFEAAVLSLNDAQLPVAGSDTPITFSTTYEAEDRLLGGVRFDTFTLKIDVPEDLRDDPTMLALAALGQIGFIGQAAVVDGHVVVTTFDDLETMDRALAAITSAGGLGTAAEFPSFAGAQRSAVGYVDLRALAQTLAPFYAIAGDTDPAQADPDTAPVAFAIAADDGQAAFKLFLPTSAINALAVEDFEPNLRTQDNANGNNPGGFDNGPGTLGPGNPRTTPRNTPRTNPGRAPGREPLGPGRAPGRTPGRTR